MAQPSGSQTRPTPRFTPTPWPAGPAIQAKTSLWTPPAAVPWASGPTAPLIWVVDWNQDKLYAYTLADDTRDSDKDITLNPLENTSPRGIWSNDTTIWVADSGDAKLYAYDLTNGDRVTGHDISLHFSNAGAAGIWANDDTAWAVNGITTDGSPFDRMFTYNNTPVTVTFESAAYTVAESDDSSTTEVQENQVTVKVKLDNDPERSVTIPITKANQGGASSSDYSGVPANVTFASGDTEKSITFSAASDSANDDGESVKLGFGTLPTGVSAGSTDETTVSITDDDVPAVTVTFEQGTYTVAEGSSVTVKVMLSADPERSVTIPITKANQGGASNSDYSGVPDNVTFGSGDTEKTIIFSATQDSVDDDDESVKLGFGTLPTGVRRHHRRDHSLDHGRRRNHADPGGGAGVVRVRRVWTHGGINH